MPTPPDPASEPRPLAGWLFHGAVRLGVVFAATLAGWRLGNGGITGALLAFLFVAASAAIWLLVYAPADPAPGPFGKLAVPGWMRLLLEWTLVIAAGSAIWVCWNRAAAETYLTIALFDYAVQYQRIMRLARSA